MMGLASYTGVSIRFLLNKANPTITSQTLIKDVNTDNEIHVLHEHGFSWAFYTRPDDSVNYPDLIKFPDIA